MLAEGEYLPLAWLFFSKGCGYDLILLLIQQGYDEQIQQQACQVVTTEASTNHRIPTLESHYSHLERTLLLPVVIHPKAFQQPHENLQLDSSVWEIITGCAAGCCCLTRVRERWDEDGKGVRCSPSFSPRETEQSRYAIMALLEIN